LAGSGSPFVFATASTKSVNLGPISGLREWNFWQRDAIREQHAITPSQAYSRVPWLYRAVMLRSNSVGDVPWVILHGKTEILTSEDDETAPPAELTWVRPPPVGRNVDPTRATLGELLRLIELDLCLSGKAYWLTDANRLGKRKSYRRALPSTIALDTDPDVGLKGFIRTVGDKETPILLGTMPFWWLPNPDAEIGPGPSPASVALRAAGLMHNIDEFSTGFFDRGAINTTILSVEGNPQDSELRKLETWWKRLLRGNKRAHETVALRASIKPVVVGQPPKDLAMVELTDAKRIEISVALGVPQGILDDQHVNRATAEQSEWNYWTLTILPDCELIETGLNRQVFAPLGYEFRFQPQKLEAIRRRKDAKALELLSAVIGGGITQNEFRNGLGLEPMPGGDELRVAPVAQVSAGERVGGLPRAGSAAA